MKAGVRQSGVPWLSPTSAARLLTCPASVVGLVTGPPPRSPAPSTGTSAGALAHAALQRWVMADDWRYGDRDGALVDHFHAVAEARKVAVAAVMNGRVTEARLEQRASSLGELMRQAGADATAEAEVTLHDSERRLWGTLDLLITSDRGVWLIDLKSGMDAAQSLLPAVILSQLSIYSHLVAAVRGRAPTWVGVFSLRQGAKQVPVSPSDLGLLGLLDERRSAWMAHDRPALPAPEVCRYCTRRPGCDPHWIALRAWGGADGVEGQLLRAQTAENGRTALLVQNATGSAWVSNMRGEGFQELVGHHVRVMRIRRRTPAGQSSDAAQWQATDSSAIASVGD
ncbi:PD-(D/E)XK nuclease superfamily protein [Geodermatophilus saharensis]|uniref:PD-(D/E)XK nuclease superfamily protein n=1 Tax=Geodermatophilus saharensis TaxID=1137994 RepID=A0A239EGL1_9ACTN|nr:PD-(D/E)XK nuclease family protein [Geodermatophilus saharensis]SNS43408.1 PD-(D/E)XK nuclease superfamily protein [Geodermatophilus saharensis]